ncbi:MAG: hypothetical protein ACKO0V_21655 [bacterium]
MAGTTLQAHSAFGSSPGMARAGHDAPAKAGSPMSQSGWLMVLATLVWVAQVSACWATGYRDYCLNLAIEQGVVEIENRERLNHDTAVAAAKRESQRQTQPFWRFLHEIGDFLLEPAALWFRFWVIPLAVSAACLLAGRSVEAESLRPSVAWCLLAALPRPVFELASGLFHLPNVVPAGLNLLVPQGFVLPAGLFVALASADIFWVLSVVLMLLALWRPNVARGPMLAAVVGLFLLEWVLRVSLGIVVGAAMRETLIQPEPFRVGRGPGP